MFSRCVLTSLETLVSLGAVPTVKVGSGVHMTVVRIECSRISDWDTFHTVFAESFGFPSFYGRNMNAWIDCMSYLDDLEAGMSTVTVPVGEVLTLHLEGVDEFAIRCSEKYTALIECAAFVNWRRSSEGNGAILALAFYKHT